MELIYLAGDATQPKGKGTKIITHVCNNVGGWGAGFVLALSKRWKEPERAYRAWHSVGKTIAIVPSAPGGVHIPFTLGETQLVQVSPKVYVANMIAQSGIRKRYANQKLVDYEALSKCLEIVKNHAIRLASKEIVDIHMPRIATGLAGGSWDIVESIIDNVFDGTEIFIYVYDLPEKKY